MGRIVCRFSCGAASAVATKLALAQYGATHEVVIINAFIVNEHEDNRRFLADCEKWFGQSVIVLRDEKYGADIHEVWRRKRYIKGQQGAPCSKALKRDVLDAFCVPDDVHVLGYTREEADRFDDFQDFNPHMKTVCPLIERDLGKADCLAIVDRAGIVLPMMYRLGFHNANCKGCCKGGEGYWNKVRVVFPEDFEETAKIQDLLGPGSYFFRNRKTGERISLRQLSPTAGRYVDEPEISCSFFCDATAREFNAERAAMTQPQDSGDSEKGKND